LLVRDVSTIEHARRAAEAASNAKNLFLANVSHEIRTPLNGVLGTLQLLGDSELDAQQRRLLQLAVSSAESLCTVTNDVVDLSRLQAGRLELEITPFDVHALLREACDFWRPLATSKGVALGLTVDRKLPRRVRGDPARVRQIVNNFVSNAIKFTECGRVDVRLGQDDLQAATKPGELRLKIEVQDTGVGIARADQKRLFEDFTQLSQPGMGEHGGAGLGLAICRELSRLLNGTVGVSSAPGAGSTFWLRFPLQLDTAPAAEPAQTARAAFEPLLNAEALPPRVLVAEDVPTNQMIVQMMLKGFGCQVELVANGVEAVNAVAHGTYDLVLMDVAMPEMDGVEATRRIRAMGDERARIPVVGLTAFVLPEEQERFRAAGMDLVLNKPLQRATLYDTLVAALAPTAGSADGSRGPASTQGLDATVLAEMTEGLSAAQVDELLARVVEDIGVHARRALDCVRAGDAEGLARSCHALKGLAGSFGSSELLQLARRIEQHCRAGDVEAAMAAALGELDRTCRVTRAALGTYGTGRASGARSA
jgi:CheY-like chemotaxis protein